MAKRRLNLSSHDESLANKAIKCIRNAITNAAMPAAVVKRIIGESMKHRNKGRAAALRRYPFQGKCELSGLPINREIAALDELEPEKGYSGMVRWICQKANGSGRGTCGKC